MDHLSGNLRSLIGLTRREGFSKTEKARLWRRIEHAVEQREVERMAPRARIGFRWLSLSVAAAACALFVVQLPQAELSRVACQLFDCSDGQPNLATNTTANAPTASAAASPVPSTREQKTEESCAPSAPRGRAAGNRVASRGQRGFSRGTARSTGSHGAAANIASESTQARSLPTSEGLSLADRIQSSIQDDQSTRRVASGQTSETSSQTNSAPSELELRERRLKKLIHDAKQRYNGALGERALLAASQRALPSVARY